MKAIRMSLISRMELILFYMPYPRIDGGKEGIGMIGNVIDYGHIKPMGFVDKLLVDTGSANDKKIILGKYCRKTMREHNILSSWQGLDRQTLPRLSAHD